MKHQTALKHAGFTSTCKPVPQADRIHKVEMVNVAPVQATVVLHADTKAVMRDGSLRIVWQGDMIIDDVPMPGLWELDPAEAHAKGLCTINYQSNDQRAELARVVTEVDDMIVLAAQDERTKRMAERIRRMLVEVIGGEDALNAAKN